MNDFFRVLRLSLRYKFTVVAALVCALAIALLWGANIGTVYPFVEVVFEGQSLREWVDNEIEVAEEKSDELAGDIAALQVQLSQAAPEQQPDIRVKISGKEARREAELRALQARRWMQPYIHRYLPASPFPTLLLIVAVLIVGTLAKDVFLIFSTLLTERLCHLATLRLRNDFYRRTLRMDLTSFGEQGTANLMSRFTYEMDQVTHGLRTVFGKAIREPLKMVACFAGAAIICWRLLILSLVVAPVAAWLLSRLAKSIKRANRRAMEEMSQIYNTLSETFRGIKAVKAFTMERHERLRFYRASKQFFRRAMKIARYDSLVRPATELMGIATICLAILGGAYLVLNQETHLLGIKMSDRALSISSLLLFYALLAGVSDPARKLSDVFSRVQRSAAAAERIFELLDRKPAIQDKTCTVELPDRCRQIVFDKVGFAYGEEPVLRDIDLEITSGETLAIVGPNGCGKSTLANLILRLFDPQTGAVRFDGVDLRDARLRDVRRRIGIVTQETQLFNETVRQNIAYGSPGATPEQIQHAARRAHAHRFIEEKLENGYDTVIGESGNRLSGGQRQRIALARAILRDPEILILDEATSQVDLESEQVIRRVLSDFVRDRTTIIITHRMSILELANRIIVMEAGRITDIGTHTELIQRCDLYGRLYNLEFRAA